MPTTLVKGDFLERTRTPSKGGGRAIAFGADVAGTMNAGIAVAVKKRWPAIEAWWAESCGNGKAQVGEVWAYDAEDGATVYALALQKAGGRVKVSWLESAIKGMLGHAMVSGVTEIAIPRLWGGATGLDGDRAKRILQEEGDASAVALVVFETFIRGDANAPSEAVEAPEPTATEADEPAEADESSD